MGPTLIVFCLFPQLAQGVFPIAEYFGAHQLRTAEIEKTIFDNIALWEAKERRARGAQINLYVKAWNESTASDVD